MSNLQIGQNKNIVTYFSLLKYLDIVNSPISKLILSIEQDLGVQFSLLHLFIMKKSS